MIKILATIAIISLLVFFNGIIFSKNQSTAKKDIGRFAYFIGIGCVLAIIIIKIVEYFYH
jgi:hypothetical protein